MKIGIVFSGGASKGAYQLGFCKAVSEYVSADEIVISASSIGVYNAMALVSGKLDVAEGLWRENDIKSLRDFYKVYIKTNFSYDSIDAVFKPIKNDFFVTISKYPSMKPEYANLKGKDEQTQKKILYAGLTVPKFMKAISINGNKYVDGAYVDIIPTSPLPSDLQYLIVVHFDPQSDYEKLSNVKTIDIPFTEDNSFILKSFDTKKKSIEVMIEAGYTKSKKILETIFIEKKEIIHSKSLLNNGDYYAGQINKVVKKILI